VTPTERTRTSTRGTLYHAAEMAGLSEDEVRAALEELPGWRFEKGEIFKQYKFPTFMEAIAFIDRLAEAADAAEHHPDLENHYNRVRVALHTWDENAITQKDLDLAHRIEAASVLEAGI
jgi:4a-hydroxytetrahydrobiopterin dehydratase